MPSPAFSRAADLERLEQLRRLDSFRVWQSLSDLRYCLGCGRIITGREILLEPSSEGEEMAAYCPTKGCRSIPMDWVLVTDEVAARVAERAATSAGPAPSLGQNGFSENSLRKSLGRAIRRLRFRTSSRPSRD